MDNEEHIDFREYLRVLYKRRWTIIAVFTVVFLTVAIHSFTADPIYRATSRLVIEKENPNLVSIQEVMAVDATGFDYYQTQYQIIQSRTVAREVIRRLDLENSPEFSPEPEDDFLSKTKQWIKGSVQWWRDGLNSLLRTDPERAVLAGLQADKDSLLVSEVIDRINVEPIRNSRLVDVSIETGDPVLAARMANELVRAYIDQNLEIKLTAAKDAVHWLSERIDEERKKVEVAENALLQYKERFGIVTDFSSDAEKITAQKLAQLNAQVVEAEAKRVEAETRYQQALAVKESPDMLDSIPEVLSNELVREIKKMEVNLYTRMSELSKKYGRRHPQMLALESELKDLNKRKNVEVKRVINSLRNNYKIALAREASLKKAMERQKKESLDMNQKAVQYGVLRRQAESARNMYELLVKRFKETSLTEEMKTGNIRVIDRAEIPEFPVKPRKKLNLLLGLAVGLTLGIGLAFLAEQLDNTVKLPEHVKHQLRIPYLGPVPVFSTNGTREGVTSDLIALHEPKATASESFRGIRTGIIYSSADRAPQVILVTSAGPQEGKTTCAANLGITMAQAGSRVVIMDCDLRRPRLHKSFNIKRDTGISSALVGSCGLSDILLPSGVHNLDLIPSGPVPPNPSEILGSKKMGQILDALKKGYNRILIDSPPITAVTDSVLMSRLADGVILVIRAGDTPRPVIQNGLEQLQNAGASILGGVLNGVKADRGNYYYYQYYYYYYGDDGSKRKKPGRRKKEGNMYG